MEILPLMNIMHGDGFILSENKPRSGLSESPKNSVNSQKNAENDFLFDQNNQPNNVGRNLFDSLPQNVKELTVKKVEFTVDQQSGRMAIAVIDKATEEIIREIPPQKMLEMLNSLRQNMGYLIDQKA